MHTLNIYSHQTNLQLTSSITSHHVVCVQVRRYLAGMTHTVELGSHEIVLYESES